MIVKVMAEQSRPSAQLAVMRGIAGSGYLSSVAVEVRRGLSKMRQKARAQSRLADLRRRLKKQYGSDLSFAIHPHDLMYLWYLNGSPTQAQATYLKTGDKNMRELQAIMDDVGLSFRPDLRLLDFGCGYGRLTRYLVTRLRSSQIRVSDVDPNAVDYVARTLNVTGFCSATQPQELRHLERYDLILAISLFSHLPRNLWAQWLEKLSQLLAENGVLIFTTQGPSLFGTLTPTAQAKALAEASDDGFCFVSSNETQGRLDVAEYGQSYVNHDWVARIIKAHSAGNLLGYYPRGMWGRQDVYVLRKN